MRRFLSRSLLLAIAIAAIVVIRLDSPDGARASGPNTWTNTYAMAAERTNTSAVLMADGRVLLTGGENDSSWFATAQLYDPLTNAWSLASPMNVARSRHQSVRLLDGRVLVAGGESGATQLMSVEIYNSGANAWTLVAPMGSLHRTLTTLPDGDVLAVGDGVAERYDVGTNAWTPVGGIVGRFDHTATPLADGRVLVAAGQVFGGPAQAQIFDPVTNSWSSAGTSIHNPRFGPTSVRLADGRVMVIGGFSPDATATAEIYDPATNTWTAAPPMGDARALVSATLLPNGLVLVAGGLNMGGELVSAEVYNPTANAWSGVAPMNGARRNHVMVTLTSGKVLAAGGFPTMGNGEVYEPGPIPPPGSTTPVATPTNTYTPTTAPPTFPPTDTPTPTSSSTPTPTGTPGPATDTPTATFTPGVPPPTGSPPPTGTPTSTPQTLPDLIVQSISDRQSFADCTVPAGLRIVIKNQTSIAAGASSAFVTAGFGGSETVAVPAIPGNSSATVYSYVTGLPIGDTYTATADSAHVITESNESNNTLSVNIPLATLPTCTPTRTFTPVPATPTQIPTPTATATATATATPCVGADSDSDGVPDCSDNCPSDPNPTQANTDGNFSDNSPPYVEAVDDRTIANSDSLGDACDPDDDNDSLPDDTETSLAALQLSCPAATAATDPLKLDTDGDHITDGAECALGSDPANQASKPAIPPFPAQDTDHDLLSNAFEAIIGTSPNVADSDGDGVPDGIEYRGYGSNPLAIDTDGDGVRDRCEIASINADTIVNSGDQALLATEIMRAVPPAVKLADFDLNKDTVLNSGDQALLATGIGPGKCP